MPPPRRGGVKGLKVAVMPEHPEFPVETAVQDRIQALRRFPCKGRALEIDETARPLFDMKAAFRAFVGLLIAPLVTRGADKQFWMRMLTSLDFSAR